MEQILKQAFNRSGGQDIPTLYGTYTVKIFSPCMDLIG
jgi:hypothetical protein